MVGVVLALLGLVVSAVARSVDQAVGTVPLVLIPQLLFAGALVPLSRIPGIAAALAEVTDARWAYAGMGSSIDMDKRLEERPSTEAALGFGRSFFTSSPLDSVIALVCFTLSILAATATVLQWCPPNEEG